MEKVENELMKRFQIAMMQDELEALPDLKLLFSKVDMTKLNAGSVKFYLSGNILALKFDPDVLVAVEDARVLLNMDTMSKNEENAKWFSSFIDVFVAVLIQYAYAPESKSNVVIQRCLSNPQPENIDTASITASSLLVCNLAEDRATPNGSALDNLTFTLFGRPSCLLN